MRWCYCCYFCADSTLVTLQLIKLCLLKIPGTYIYPAKNHMWHLQHDKKVPFNHARWSTCHFTGSKFTVWKMIQWFWTSLLWQGRTIAKWGRCEYVRWSIFCLVSTKKYKPQVPIILCIITVFKVRYDDLWAWLDNHQSQYQWIANQ